MLAPLLAWSLRFVDDFSHDIITAVDHNHTYIRQLDASAIGATDRTEVSARLKSYLASLTHHRTPVPGHLGQPNMRYISAQIRCRPTALRKDPRWRSLIDAAAANLGVTDYRWLTTDITATADGKKWVEGIAGKGILALRPANPMLNVGGSGLSSTTPLKFGRALSRLLRLSSASEALFPQAATRRVRPSRSRYLALASNLSGSPRLSLCTAWEEIFPQVPNGNGCLAI